MAAARRREPLAKPAAVAEYLGIKTSTLRNWRSRRVGPPYIKLNGHEVRYRMSDVEDPATWLENQTAQPQRQTRSTLRTA